MKRSLALLAASLFVLYICVPLVVQGDLIALAATIGALYYFVRSFRALRALRASRKVGHA